MDRWLPKVRKRTLLLMAGVVWLAAGINIMRIGVPDMVMHWHFPLWPLLWAVLVFSVFFFKIFRQMVQKHSKRIVAYGDELISCVKFFDGKGYAMMIFMMIFGVLLRQSGWIVPLYLGVFYTGLGASLMGAGFLFGYYYLKASPKITAGKEIVGQ